MEKKSITSFLSINSHVFPRLSFMTGGGKIFQCTCPMDEQGVVNANCECSSETGETTEPLSNITNASTTTTNQNPNTSALGRQSNTPTTTTNTSTTTNQNPNTNTIEQTENLSTSTQDPVLITNHVYENISQSGNDNYDTYTEPQTESEA